MKKSNLFFGILFILLGAGCLTAALVTDTNWDNLLFLFTGALAIPGFEMVFKYLYWTSPKNKDRYAERIENQKIELHDELKTKLRDKAGRYAYLVGLAVIALLAIVLSVLGALGVNVDTKVIVFCLFMYLVFQYIAGVVIFRHLSKKY